jgi:hypothetical protein
MFKYCLDEFTLISTEIVCYCSEIKDATMIWIGRQEIIHI